MKKTILVFLAFIPVLSFNTNAQVATYVEKYGNTLNIGAGIGGYSGYYGYIGRSLPVFNMNYELNVANYFTLAPFASFYTYRNKLFWGDNSYPFKYYYFRETVIPLGFKGTYYFDKVLRAGPKWDFYLASSLGISIVNSNWDSDYHGDKNYYQLANLFFIDVHAGIEYHIIKRLGIFLDISSGVSTIGLAFH